MGGDAGRAAWEQVPQPPQAPVLPREKKVRRRSQRNEAATIARAAACCQSIVRLPGPGGARPGRRGGIFPAHLLSTQFSPELAYG
jgi:hypothetical protein